jgi:hypothetical protein
MTGNAFLFRALDAKGLTPHVQAELPPYRTEEGELIKEV